MNDATIAEVARASSPNRAKYWATCWYVRVTLRPPRRKVRLLRGENQTRSESLVSRAVRRLRRRFNLVLGELRVAHNV